MDEDKQRIIEQLTRLDEAISGWRAKLASLDAQQRDEAEWLLYVCEAARKRLAETLLGDK